MASAITDAEKNRDTSSFIPTDRFNPNIARLRGFIKDFAAILSEQPDVATATDRGATLLANLVAVDDWLPPAYASPDPTRYRQYLLHCDSAERFSVVSFVWGPGQSTPIHDHRIWGLVGVLRGAELIQRYRQELTGALRTNGTPHRLERGEVDRFGPAMGDIHRVANAHDDKVSISIHVYGANIGGIERATYDSGGQAKRFVSGYANRELPNLWDRSPA